MTISAQRRRSGTVSTWTKSTARTPQARAIRNCFQVGPLRRGAGSIARDQGQIRSHVDLEVIVDQLWGACYHRLLLPVPDQPLTAPSPPRSSGTSWRAPARVKEAQPPGIEQGSLMTRRDGVFGTDR